MVSRFFPASLVLSHSAQALALSGTICGPEQEPISNIAITFTADDTSVVESRTDEEGHFSITLENPQVISGTIAVDPVEVIESDFILPETILWNGGLPTEIPVIELDEISPTLTFERRLDDTSCLRFNFDWVPGARPETLRTYRVECSDDMLNWSVVMNVGMACPPIEFIDETAIDQKNCFYHIHHFPFIWMPAVPINGIGLIGDPAIVPNSLVKFAPDWPGNVVLVDNDFLIPPEMPVIEPEIKLVESVDANE